MKRSWIGFGLLLVLLILGIFSTVAMTRLHRPVGQQLEQAAEMVLSGNWEEAGRRFALARESWEAYAHFRACLADHGPVEEVDAGFALLEVYCRTREDAAFAAGCRELARKAAAVGEAHAFVWWNIL